LKTLYTSLVELSYVHELERPGEMDEGKEDVDLGGGSIEGVNGIEGDGVGGECHGEANGEIREG